MNYNQPKPVPVDKNNGYPNKTPSTQTVRTRGTKNTTRGNKHSKKMG